jgi:hypothetical protein
MTDQNTPKSRFAHTQLTVRIPARIVQRVDEEAVRQMTTRSCVLRQILAAATSQTCAVVQSPIYPSTNSSNCTYDF